MLPLTRQTVGVYLNRYGAGDWSRFDSRRRSKFHNRDLKAYDLSLAELVAEPSPATRSD